MTLCALLVLGWAEPALGQSGRPVDSATRAAARQLGIEGVEAYQAGDYARALERLERAYAALPAPSLALWSARALEKAGKLVEASERYLEGTRSEVVPGGDREVQRKAQADAARERDALSPRIPYLTVNVQGPEGVVVVVNDKPLSGALVGTPVPTNPGRVSVVARADEREARANVTLAEGARETLTLRLGVTEPTSAAAPAAAPLAATPAAEAHPTPAPAAAPAPAAPPPSAPLAEGGAPQKSPLADTAQPGGTQRTLGWVTLGVGTAGVLTGAVTGALVLSKRDDLGCDSDSRCPLATTDAELDSANTLRTVSTLGFIAGGVLAAAGITLLSTAPSRQNNAHAAAYLGWASLGVRGRF